MWRQVVLSVAVFAVSLVALFSLVPVLGVLGFAWSVYLFYASTVVFAPWLLGRYFPEPRFRRMVAVSMILSGVIVVSGLLLVSLDVKTSAIMGVVLVVVSLLVIYVKVMTTGDRSFVRQMVREVLHLGR
jgi:hypothetical protein